MPGSRRLEGTLFLDLILTENDASKHIPTLRVGMHISTWQYHSLSIKRRSPGLHSHAKRGNDHRAQCLTSQYNPSCPPLNSLKTEPSQSPKTIVIPADAGIQKAGGYTIPGSHPYRKRCIYPRSHAPRGNAYLSLAISFTFDKTPISGSAFPREAWERSSSSVFNITILQPVTPAPKQLEN